MQHIDSLIKESQRLNPLSLGEYSIFSVPLMTHVMPKDHAFSDGAMVPKGTTISVATPRAHLNGDRYEYLLQFDGFRYVKLKEQCAVVAYDVKLEDMGVRPADRWIAANCLPNPTAQVLFKKRTAI
ncbi:hypothetical protein NLJ89_g10893 [Agrocybe chaxingu]|uniref:Uncharacterized protein n=1 Tax=Agrocybe chaxingu TaxID=84603 RepID=A0A9W8JPV9_9AGAR|nr:hypothetical protein NLJ89_g10893 [Agrocybe chaxingu]